MITYGFQEMIKYYMKKPAQNDRTITTRQNQ